MTKYVNYATLQRCQVSRSGFSIWPCGLSLASCRSIRTSLGFLARLLLVAYESPPLTLEPSATSPPPPPQIGRPKPASNEDSVSALQFWGGTLITASSDGQARFALIQVWCGGVACVRVSCRPANFLAEKSLQVCIWRGGDFESGRPMLLQ